MPGRLTHLDESGAARMVDIGGKPTTRRIAVATGRIALCAESVAALHDGAGPKGDALAAARIAGIMAAKRTGDLIPLCHPIPIDSVSIDFTIGKDALTAATRVSTSGQTGIEMEAITATSIALLTIFDMLKAIDKSMVIDAVRLIAKDGGKSGRWRAEGYEELEI